MTTELSKGAGDLSMRPALPGTSRGPALLTPPTLETPTSGRLIQTEVFGLPLHVAHGNPGLALVSLSLNPRLLLFSCHETMRFLTVRTASCVSVSQEQAGTQETRIGD